MIELIEEEAQELISLLEDLAGFGGAEMSLRASHMEDVLRRRLDEAGIKHDGIPPIGRREP